MPNSFMPSAPSFTQVTRSTSELRADSRTIGLTFTPQYSEVEFWSSAAGSYSSLRLNRSEIQALAAELQRILNQPSLTAV